jgi:hypothetical protein
MAVIRIDFITEDVYYHMTFTSEKNACKAIDDIMNKYGISNCSMASKEDLIAVNAAIAEHYGDSYNQDNYCEWHDIASELKELVANEIKNGSLSDDKLLEVANELKIDINFLFSE